MPSHPNGVLDGQPEGDALGDGSGDVSGGGPSDSAGGGSNSAAKRAEQDNAEVRALLEKGLYIQNLSYTARFNSDASAFIYEYYKRDNLTKEVIHDGDSQSISVCDGKSTVYYSLPERIGFSMMEAGDDMGLVPSIDALLNEAVYTFQIMGEEQFSGYLCQVVETEDEYGVLKIWISKTLGYPVKYIGADDFGWYSLELTEIQLGAPPEGVFAIPSDVVMRY